MVERGVDTVILGCTHYPLLSGLLQLELGPDVVLVSSAEETAKDVYAELLGAGLERTASGPPEHAFLATGAPVLVEHQEADFLLHVLGRPS